MVVLAIDTASRRGSMAWADDAGERTRTGESDQAHGDRLPLEATRWLATMGHTLADVDRFAVVVGPGSFTGLRVGLATVQGWALALNRFVAPVSTFDAVAESWRGSPAYRPDVALAVCVEGHKTEIFGALFPPAGAGERPAFDEPTAGPADVVAARLRAAAGDVAVVLAGTAVGRHRETLAGGLAPIGVHDEPGMTLAGAAASLARRPDALLVEPGAVRVLYVRPPHAEVPRDRVTGGAAPPTAKSFHVRRASGPRDLAAVEALQRDTFTNPWGAEAMQWELDHTDVARLYVVAAEGDRIVGYCACWLVFDELHINSLAIDPACRRQGAATSLLEHVFAEAVAAGARSATLEVRASNLPALRLYERLGFRVDGTRRDYYQSPREDALILWNRQLGARGDVVAAAGT